MLCRPRAARLVRVAAAVLGGDDAASSPWPTTLRWTRCLSSRRSYSGSGRVLADNSGCAFDTVPPRPPGPPWQGLATSWRLPLRFLLVGVAPSICAPYCRSVSGSDGRGRRLGRPSRSCRRHSRRAGLRLACVPPTRRLHHHFLSGGGLCARHPPLRMLAAVAVATALRGDLAAPSLRRRERPWYPTAPPSIPLSFCW